MKKTRKDSQLKVWSERYINFAYAREPGDQDAEVIQIQATGQFGVYLVEVVEKGDK